MRAGIAAAALLLLGLPLPGPSASADEAAAAGTTLSAAEALVRLAPGANPEVIALALSAMHCAKAGGVAMDASRLAVIDYSKPSLEPRLWVFDLSGPRLLFEELVAHGKGSGENLPTRFSNQEGSHASSLGLFVTADTYVGQNGYSLRMDGLEPGVNDRARERAIVMHGAPYVNAVFGERQGRLGRSWGCPAVREAVARGMIDVLKGGQFVFAYYPDTDWLSRSALLRCPAA
jgi:hypothetical protein